MVDGRGKGEGRYRRRDDPQVVRGTNGPENSAGELAYPIVAEGSG
jgi:hypothetical protein